MAPIVQLKAGADAAVHAAARQLPARPACAQRRAVLLGPLLGCALPMIIPSSAQAGWDGPANFLKSRQVANVGKLTAPFAVALVRLQEARLLVTQGPDMPDVKYNDALELVRRSSCNCYSFVPFDDATIESRASLLTQNFKLADPCTFRIIVKNVAMLREDDDPLRVEAYQQLDEVIRSYQRLDGALLQADELDSETKHMVLPLLDQTLEMLEALKKMVIENINNA